MKTVLVTGAAGFLGSHLVNAMKEMTEEFNVIAIDIATEQIPIGDNIICYSNESFFISADICNIDIVINCAFARGNDPKALVSALDYTERLINKLKQMDIGTIINISSQGIYRAGCVGEFVDEKGQIEPNEMYSLAKYAQERLISSSFGEVVTNIRMASLGENARFLVFFVDSVIKGKKITVTAPKQYVSIIDIKDAVNGIIQICCIPKKKRKRIYNLGAGKQNSILELANITNKVGNELGFKTYAIKVIDNQKESAVGMDCTVLTQDTGWIPRIAIEQTIKNIYGFAMEDNRYDRS